jgi:tetratricopeptide (TPR) repeat protein
MGADEVDPTKRAAFLYGEPLDPARTKELGELLKVVPADTKALAAVVTFCDYLNRWNNVGKEHLPTAEADVVAALAIDPDLARGHYAHGFIHRAKGDHEQALRSFQKAAELDPRDARAIAQAGAEQLYLGHPNEALSAITRALAIAPGHPAAGMFLWIRGRALFFDGKYTETLPQLRRSIELWPALWYNRAYEISALALTGDLEQARSRKAGFIERFRDLDSIASIQEAEKTNPNTNEFVVAGRRKFHEGLVRAGFR